MAPKVSIIVPVYKVEKYLNRCVDSILAQTFTDFECILVDDGSPDGCPAICDEYAKKDNRIKVIHQENKGVSAARNAGLDAALGEWIGFVDSDDWIEKDMYQILYEDAVESKSDVVVCGLYGRKIKINKIILKREEAIKNIFKINGFGGFSVLRLINAKKLGKLRFDVQVSYMEDVKFFYELFKKCESIYWHNVPLYHYENNEESVTRKYGLTSQAKSALTMLDEIHLNESNKKLKHVIYLNRLRFILDLLIQYIKAKDFSDENYQCLYSETKKNFLIILFSKQFSLKRKILVCLMKLFHLYSPKIMDV